MLPKMNKYLKWGFPQEDCLILMDTEMEREIGLGNQYNYPALKDGECLISDGLAQTLEVKEGDYIYHSIKVAQNIKQLVDIYNEKFAKPKK